MFNFKDRGGSYLNTHISVQISAIDKRGRTLVLRVARDKSAQQN